MHPQKETLLKYCNFRVVPTSNYFVSINTNNQYFLRVVKPIVLIEYCRTKPPRFHDIVKSGLLALHKDCRIATDKISLRPRTNYQFDSGEIIFLANHTHDMTSNTIFEQIQMGLNFTIPQLEENVLIQDYVTEFDSLIAKADKLIERTKTEIKWKEIHTENILTFRNSFGFTIFVAVFIILIIVGIVWYLYTRFFNINTWVQLAGVLGRGNSENSSYFCSQRRL